MLVIKYLHGNKFVYRDLKPDNIIITGNHNVILIDFDRMIKQSDFYKNDYHTTDFSSKYVAPGVNNGIMPENDIYSIGQILFFILNEIDPINIHSKNDVSHKNTFLMNIYKNCVENDIKKRPSIHELICKSSYIKGC